nr:glycerophosphodiester phosphodiesterase family protein [Clostridium sp. MD294]
MGAIEDKKETNSKEAFIHSWENGYKVMEADFSFTSDGILVVRHDFDQDSYYNLEQKVNGSTEMNSSRFSNEKINFRYTPITATQILALLAEYEDVYLITDTKYTDTQKIQKEFTDIVNAAKAMGREDILNRVVVQIYNTEMLDTVKQIYPFTNWIYTLYQTPNPNYDDIATFCANNGIDVVTINYEIVKKENIQKLTAKGIRVYAHTVNRMLDFKMMLEAGCYGIYTDYIKPYDLDIVNMKKTPFWSGRILVNQKEMAVNFNTIMGKDYIRLRDFASVVSDTEAQFEIKYDSKTNTVNIIKGGVYTSIGNEMLLDNSEKYITKKSNYRIAVDGTAVEAQCYTIDGDLYFDIEQLAQILGMTAQKKQDGKGYIVATIT